jgi:5-methylcytosine-specific restriction endonuclease McrA
MAQLIRLPNTRADVVHTNGTPVVVDHLPDVDSTVTLGVSEINEDHIVPSISALPKSHTPNKEDYVLMEIDNASSGITAGTSEELPLRLLPPPEKKSGDAVTARVRGYTQSVIWVASDDIEEDIIGVYRHLQAAYLALRQSEYQDATQHLTEAIQSCPSPSLLRRLLIVQKIIAQAVTSIQGDSSLADVGDSASTEAKRLREFDESTQTTAEISALLSAREAEMQAVNSLLTALDKFTRDTNSNIQPIPQGATGKALRCRPLVLSAKQHVADAKKLKAKTPFEQQIPSDGVWLVIEQFKDLFPITVRLQSPESSEDNAGWLQHLLLWERVLHDDVTLIDTDADANADCNSDSDASTWSRPATPETMGITPVAEIGDNKNAHIEPAQNSDSEISTTGQTLNSRSSSEGRTETTSAGENSMGTTTIKTSGTGTETANSTGESPTNSLPKLQELRRQAERESSKNPKREDVSSSTTTTSRYKRSSAVREYALARADGTCELCGEDAPFLNKTGDPYLEVHHVNELSDGGADDPSIVGAVCPSCHKEIHYGKHGDELNEKLRERLQDGLGDVGVVDE